MWPSNQPKKPVKRAFNRSVTGTSTEALARYSSFSNALKENSPANSSPGRLVTMLSTPAEAFLPNNVPWGPRNTSIRSMSNRSEKAIPERAKTTPSTTVDTLGSAAVEKEMVPMPRRNRAELRVVVPLRKVSDGTEN